MQYSGLKKIVLLGSVFFNIFARSIVSDLSSIVRSPHKEDLSWYEVQKRSEHAVVQIFSHVVEPNIVKPYRRETNEGSGSGFLISSDGLILTNYHVVSGGMQVGVQMPLLFGKKMMHVSIKSVCPDRDLALLKLSLEDCDLIEEELGSMPFLKLGDSNTVERSDELIAMGFPLGLEAPTSSTGVVSTYQHVTITSSSGRQVEARCIQVTTPINPGNSGGPTLNRKGEVVGINTAGIDSAQNIGYAVPISEFLLIKDAMMKQAFVKKPNLGARFCYAAGDELAHLLNNPYPSGCYLTQVYEYGLLGKMGLKAGDMLYKINGFSVDIYGTVKMPGQDDRRSVSDYISSLALGSELVLKVYRNGEEIVFKENLYCPEEPPVNWKHIGYDVIDYEIVGGILLQDLSMNLVNFFRNPEVAAQLPAVADTLGSYSIEEAHRSKAALIVTQIFATSAAQQTRSIGMGDIITEINGQKVSSLKEAREALMLSKYCEFTTFKTKDDNLIALTTKEILQDEYRLSKAFNYQVTPAVKDLLKDEGQLSSLNDL